MTRLILVRHGETAWNHAGRIQGQLDIELSDVGRAQARLVGLRLKDEPIAHAYSSDLCRCRETAEIVLEGRDVPIETLPALREVHLGRWQGLTDVEIRAKWPGEIERVRAEPGSVAPPGGENRCEVQARMLATAQEIAARHPDERVLVVSHGGALRALAAWVLSADLRANWRLRIDNCGISVVEIGDGGPLLLHWNDTSHLVAGAGPPRHRHPTE